MLDFCIQDISRNRNITEGSARVWCTREVKKGNIFRLKNNFYITREQWLLSKKNEKYSLSNRVQTPSYISLSSAISYYELSTQMYRGSIEAIAQKRTITYAIQDTRFEYHLVNEKYYHGFIRKNGFFIAAAEKALVDILYLVSLGRYAFDFSSLEIDKLNIDSLNEYLEVYPQKTKEVWNKYGRL